MSGSFLRRKRRADDGRFLPKDQAAWTRLIRRARQAARNPAQFAAELAQAAQACGRAVPPPGHAHRGSDFLQLLAKGRVFATTPAELRDGMAAQLEALADRCAEALDRPVGRPRADLA